MTPDEEPFILDEMIEETLAEWEEALGPDFLTTEEKTRAIAALTVTIQSLRSSIEAYLVARILLNTIKHSVKDLKDIASSPESIQATLDEIDKEYREMNILFEQNNPENFN